MAAILHPTPTVPARRPPSVCWPEPSVPARPVPVRPARPARPPMAVVYRRRRIVAALLAFWLLAAVLVLGRVVLASVSVLPPPAPAPATRAEVVVVQPGDTLWSIAERLDPGADVRPIVDRLVAANGPEPLQVGEEVAIGGVVAP